MIDGAHGILYNQDAKADRAFIRDVLAFPGVDAGGGWLIFELPPAEGRRDHPPGQRTALGQADGGASAQWRRTAAVRTSPPRGPQSVTLERPRPGPTGC